MSTPLSREGSLGDHVRWTAAWSLSTGGAVVARSARTGVAVARTGVGTYTVTLPAHARGTYLGAVVSLGCADGAASTRRAIPTTFSASTRTLTVVTQSTAGTAADLTAGEVVVEILLGAQP